MARMSISVPDDLRRRIEETEESVNWSQLAAKAFEAKLDDLAAQKKDVFMNGMIARLKKSKAKSPGSEFAIGIIEGQQWARRTAEYMELERLVRFRESEAWEQLFSGELNSAYSPGEFVAFKILGEEENCDREQAYAFWDKCLSGQRDTDDLNFIKGFCESAINLYGKVADQL